MVNRNNNIPNLDEAATRYLDTLTAQKREASRPEIYRFARWYGGGSSFSKLAGPAVAGYVEQLSVSDTDYEKKLELLRAFFVYAKKAGWSTTNLGTHLKSKKTKSGPIGSGGGRMQETVSLSKQKYDELVANLNTLKNRSQDLVKEMQRAAADKDFRENAPLHAAREERGHVEGRIKEIEETLKNTTIIGEKKKPSLKSTIGDKITLVDEMSGEEICYQIVDTREVNVLKGKISIASPIGKALLGRCDGDVADITAPAGKLHYRIIKIEH
jgi:transcription elongation factor GreA